MKRKVTLLFEGTIHTEIEFEGEPDGEEWSEAVAKAWADVPAEDLSEASDLTDTILED